MSDIIFCNYEHLLTEEDYRVGLVNEWATAAFRSAEHRRQEQAEEAAADWIAAHEAALAALRNENYAEYHSSMEELARLEND